MPDPDDLTKPLLSEKERALAEKENIGTRGSAYQPPAFGKKLYDKAFREDESLFPAEDDVTPHKPSSK